MLAYNPVTDVRATMHLQAHLPGALHKLITLAEANGLAGDVLDAYVEGRVQSVSRRCVQTRTSPSPPKSWATSWKRLRLPVTMICAAA